MFKERWANKNDLIRNYCLQCFDAVGWAAGRASGLKKKLSGEVLAWLSVCSEMQTCIWPSWCHCHSLCLASVKSRLVLPFWNRPTWVVVEKGPLNGCVCVCVLSETNKQEINVPREKLLQQSSAYLSICRIKILQIHVHKTENKTTIHECETFLNTKHQTSNY